MPETIQTYHPTFEKTKKLFNLRKRLWEIADGKSDGTISYEEANHLAVDAVATANGRNATSHERTHGKTLQALQQRLDS